ncbi:MAG: TetR/AcrR family transcriptional regulator [Actinomycetota bacterium]
MPPPPAPRQLLDVDRIVDAACAIIERNGLAGLSMRKLGRELGVDPMAIYHHVPNKTALLALATARTVAKVEAPDTAIEWDEWVRLWALRYWDIAADNRDLVLVGLSDPEVGAGGLASATELVQAIARGGVPDDLCEPYAFVIVDAVHGSSLAVAASDERSADRAHLRRLFEIGLDAIVAGIATRSASTR